MSDLIDSLPEEERKKLRKTSEPSWVEPMLATLTKSYFSDEGWMFERKLDGERCLAFRDGGRVRLLSRNRKEINVAYPELVETLEAARSSHFIADGEVVAFEGDVTSFARLQNRMHVSTAEEARNSGIAIYYYLFDLVYLDGYDTTKLALRHRKTLLKDAFRFHDPIHYLAHCNTEGEAYFKEACDKGWEGLIAKKADGPYVHGRSKDWLKFKCINQQEFVIAGYTEPHGSRVGFGALLVGYYRGKKLVFAGKVGTGYDDETLRRLTSQLASIERDSPAVSGDGLPRKEVHWVRPELVAEIGFAEWTVDGKLRQPRFQGLRRDKAPRDVVREEPGT
jgi:bifunctional non-homologous end joining protein LigD